MKINVVTENTKSPVYNGLVRELQRRDLFGEGDIVINLDPCIGVFTKGTKTILWEVDDFLNIGKPHYEHLIKDVDKRYIQHPEYLKHYPNGTQVLRVAFDSYFADLPRDIKYDLGFAGNIEPIDIYMDRIQKLSEQKQSVLLIRSQEYEDYLRQIAQCERVIDVLPHNLTNGLKCVHDTLYAIMALSRAEVEYDELLSHVWGKDRDFILEHHTYRNRVDQLLDEL